MTHEEATGIRANVIRANLKECRERAILCRAQAEAAKCARWAESLDVLASVHSRAAKVYADALAQMREPETVEGEAVPA